jgi:hypothetical protein
VSGKDPGNLDYLNSRLSSIVDELQVDFSNITIGSLTIDNLLDINAYVNLNDNTIIGLSSPTAGSHAVNLEYLNTRLDEIQQNLDIDLSNITIGYLTVTENSVFLSDLEMSGNNITGLENPVNSGDAVNKQYVDDAINNISATIDLSSITTGGLVVTGDSDFLNDMDLNYNRIKNVNFPVNSFDATNKAYVDELFEQCCNGTAIQEEIGIKLLPNISEPRDIVELTYSNTLQAFVTHIYIKFSNLTTEMTSGTTKCCLATVRGIRLSDTWYINTIFKGEPIGVRFYSKSNNGGMVLQYTNSNTEDSTTIEFETVRRVTVLDDLYQKYHSLQPTNGEFVKLDSGIGDMYFDKNIYDAVEIIAHVSDKNGTDFGLYFLVGMVINDSWNFHIYSVGSTTPFITFKINGLGEVEYRNNSSYEFNVQLRNREIWKSFNTFTLFKDTTEKSGIDNSLWIKETETNYIEFYIYAFKEETGEYALYDLDSYYCRGQWITNTKFYGDILDIDFYIDSDNDYAVLKYTNTTDHDVKIRYISSPNTQFQQEPYLGPHTVLRGNGFDYIMGSLDFIYKDKTLILGEESSILIKNTQVATDLTFGNTFTTLGGANINKNLIVGDELIVKNNNITPSQGDISKERIAYLNNNQSFPDDIPDFVFDSDFVKTFNAIVSVTVNFMNGQEYIGLYTLRGINKQTGWIMTYELEIGDNTYVNFLISPTGQIRYTSSDLSNWESTVICFRALTTSVVN